MQEHKARSVRTTEGSWFEIKGCERIKECGLGDSKKKSTNPVKSLLICYTQALVSIPMRV